MQGNTKVLQHLNKILRHQLTHINQYFLHARMLNNTSFDKLGSKVYKQSIREMKNADAIIERILFLEGLPNLQDLGKLYIGETPEEMIACDLRAEGDKKEDFLAAITCCEQEQDYVSRQLLAEQKNDNEEYIDFLDNQQELVKSLGISNYLQTVIE